MPRAESTLEKGSRWLEAKYNWLATSHFSSPAWLGLTVPNKDELLLAPHNSQGVSTATSFGALPMARWRGYERATGKSVAEKKSASGEQRQERSDASVASVEVARGSSRIRAREAI